ncbi:MAG: CDP-glycerol glycerophosphotransferase family protein [Christensenellales bacterium]|jgi:CDP-glycerol glycerophosphotransferase
MRSRLIYFLKHNPVMQNLILKTGGLFLRLLGRFVKTEDNLVLLCDNSGKVYEGDSAKVLFDAMRLDPTFAEHRYIWAFVEPETIQIEGAEKVKIDTFSYFLCALRAKIWITNTNIERGMRFKKSDQIYLNTWHGTGPKAFGNTGKRKYYHFEDIDILCCDGKYQRDAMVNYYGARDENIIYSGRPREDELYEITPEKVRKIKELLDIPLEKCIILYAPTWRDSKDGGKSYPIAPPITVKKWEKALGSNYLVLFRSHVVSTITENLEFGSLFKDVSTYPRINHLYAIADILITDYSSTMFDFALLNKPILCFAYDYDTFHEETHLLFDLEKEMPSGVIKQEDALLQYILSMDFDGECIKTESFKEKFINRGNDATMLCMEAIKKKLAYPQYNFSKAEKL